jgi:DNA (cytosine-5)-methyltransferase 1
VRVGSLFAGVGGFDLGFERAGMVTAWQVEKDGHCRKLLAHRFPHARQYDDVRTVGAHNLEPVDVVCGGFPCQDLSVAGKRAGLEGARSGLFYEMTRIVDELRPSWLVWENVPGLLSGARGADFARVLVELERIGYHGAWTTVDARYFGVAQRRRRVFGVFTRLDSGAARAAEVLALSARLRGNPAPSGGERKDVAPTLDARAEGGGGGRGTDFLAGGGLATAPARVTSFNWQNGSDSGAANPGYAITEGGTGPLSCSQVPAVAWALQERDSKGPDSDTKDGHLIPVLMRQREGKPGGGKGPLLSGGVSLSLSANGNDQTLFAPGAALYYSHDYNQDRVYAANGVTEAQTATRRPNYLTSCGVRRLTPTECERLQGFPDGWTEGHADSHRYRMMGNAVAVPCARWIGARLVQQPVEVK